MSQPLNKSIMRVVDEMDRNLTLLRYLELNLEDTDSATVLSIGVDNLAKLRDSLLSMIQNLNERRFDNAAKYV